MATHFENHRPIEADRNIPQEGFLQQTRSAAINALKTDEGQMRLAEDETTDPAILDQLARTTASDAVMIKLAAHKNLAVETAILLASISNPAVRASLFTNPVTSSDEFIKGAGTNPNFLKN